MTPAEIKSYVRETERRFRERTPSTEIDTAIADYRVGRTEMRTWFADAFGRNLTIDDVEDLAPALGKLFRRLRREFSGDLWL